MKVAFVYPNPRGDLLESLRAGDAPDTNLLGQNHMSDLGIESWIHEPALRRRRRRSGLRHRLTWNLREVTLPWELGAADLAVTPLVNIFPLTARVRGRPRVLLLSYHLCATYARSSRPRRSVLRVAIRSAAGVACIAGAGRRRLLEQTGANPDLVHTVPLGIDEHFWRPAPPAENGFVLTVGRDLARDYSTFARAVERLPVRAVLVAKEENVRGLQTPENLQIRLNISPREVRDLYAGAACVVVPIRSESYPLGTENSGTIALLEAMASQRPVIATERSYLADYVLPDRTAVTVPPEDPAALRDAIEHILSNPSRAAGLGDAGRRRVESHHTTRRFAERLAAVFPTLGSAS